MADTPAARLHAYVEGYFQDTGRTKFPTVRQCADHLKMRQAQVLKLAQEPPFMLTEYANTKPADQFVESLEELAK